MVDFCLSLHDYKTNRKKKTSKMYILMCDRKQIHNILYFSRPSVNPETGSLAWPRIRCFIGSSLLDLFFGRWGFADLYVYDAADRK